MLNVRLRPDRAARVCAAAIGAIVLAAPLGGFSARAGEAATATHNVGAWDLTLDNGLRQCRVNLRPGAAGTGYEVAMPAGCHHAFPILNTVAIWTDGGEGKLQFEDAGGQPVLSFEPGQGGVLTGTGPQGELYRMQPVGQHKAMVLKVAATTEVAAATSAKAPVKPPGPKMAVPGVAEMAGHYAVLRQKTKDTGCMVTFDDKAHGPKSSLKAHLAPACRDQGIVIFDPVGWQLQGGRLVLTARKGHTTKLDLQEDGSWMKDATEGKSLSLKKM